MDDAVREERQRCLEIVECVMQEAPPEADALLTRIRNLIANGHEPMTFREQVEEK